MRLFEALRRFNEIWPTHKTIITGRYRKNEIKLDAKSQFSFNLVVQKENSLNISPARYKHKPLQTKTKSVSEDSSSKQKPIDVDPDEVKDQPQNQTMPLLDNATYDGPISENPLTKEELFTQYGAGTTRPRRSVHHHSTAVHEIMEPLPAVIKALNSLLKKLNTSYKPNEIQARLTGFKKGLRETFDDSKIALGIAFIDMLKKEIHLAESHIQGPTGDHAAPILLELTETLTRYKPLEWKEHDSIPYRFKHHLTRLTNLLIWVHSTHPDKETILKEKQFVELAKTFIKVTIAIAQSDPEKASKVITFIPTDV